MKTPIQNNLAIELHVPDFAPVKEFYSKLGFEIIAEDMITPEHSGYLVMRRADVFGDTIINFYGGDERVYEQAHFKKFDRNTPRGYEISVTIPVSNIETFFKEISASLPKNIMQELKEKTDGKTTWRDFRLVDPFGFYIRFTELIDWGQ